MTEQIIVRPECDEGGGSGRGTNQYTFSSGFETLLVWQDYISQEIPRLSGEIKARMLGGSLLLVGRRGWQFSGQSCQQIAKEVVERECSQ